MFNIVLRISSILLFVIQYVYWKVTERKADKTKPKSTAPRRRDQIGHLLYSGLCNFILLQLIGLQIFSYPYNPLLQTAGFVSVVIGVVVCIVARRELGVNWTHAHQYQIKKEHILITSGIYHYIRHPIYAGLLLCFGGVELVAGSYLIFLIVPILVIGTYVQAKREEKILCDYFGKKYKDYMKRSNMLIPLTRVFSDREIETWKKEDTL